MTTLRLATRQSPLALWQANYVAQLLRRRWPGLRTVLVPLVSTGDQDTETPLYGMGNVGVFSKEVHRAVLNGEADCAVHSCKDLPTEAPDGLATPVLLKRHDVRDALIGASSLAELPQGAVVGSSSLRRRTQLAALRPDLRFENIRGNVASRHEQVQQGKYDATILACAGLMRLQSMRAYNAVPLHPVTECIPAVAQGALAVDHRSGDAHTAHLLEALRDRQTHTGVTVERTILQGLRGGCSLPLGCYVTPGRQGWHLYACLHTGSGLHQIALNGPSHSLAARGLKALNGETPA